LTGTELDGMGSRASTAAPGARSGTGAQEQGLSSPPARVSAPLASSSSCGDFGIRIARDGTWFYHGSPITRKPLVRLFSTVLRREEDGEYWLVTPVERGRIEVEDAPFVAISVSVDGPADRPRLVFTTNVDDIVIAGPDHPIHVRPDPLSPEAADASPVPYVRVRGGLDARILRPAFYELAERAEERVVAGRRVLGVASDGAFFPIGPADA